MSTPKTLPKKCSTVSNDGFESLTKIGRAKMDTTAVQTPINLATYSNKKKTPAHSSLELQKKRK